MFKIINGFIKYTIIFTDDFVDTNVKLLLHCHIMHSFIIKLIVLFIVCMAVGRFDVLIEKHVNSVKVSNLIYIDELLHSHLFYFLINAFTNTLNISHVKIYLN